MRQLVQRGELTGAALAVNRGSEELWRGTWGWADCAQTQPVTGETLWQLASMTKPIAAVCALSLAERMTRWSGQTIPADFQPGTAAAYSPVVGFELLGRILELAGGKPLDALLRETVLAPLGMVRTGFPDSTQGLARLCQPRSGVLCDVTDEPRRHRRCGFLHRQTHRAACIFRILSAARSPLSHTESGLFRRFLLQAAQ